VGSVISNTGLNNYIDTNLIWGTSNGVPDIARTDIRSKWLTTQEPIQANKE